MTQTSGLSLCAQLYLSNATFNSAPIIQDAKWFISHAWKYKFTSVIGALYNFCAKERLDPETTIIWFDLFSNSQHGTAAKPFEWWETVFMNAVKSIGNVVMVLQPWDDPIPLKRVWCIFELYASTVTNSQFHVAMSTDEETQFLNALVDNIDYFKNLLGN
ncbi:Kinesin light chain 3, partial [Rhizoclosmatium hyalinum]